MNLANNGGLIIKTTSRETEELFQKIIQRQVLRLLRHELSRKGKRYTTREVEYCPVWAKDKNTNEKSVSRIFIRIKNGSMSKCISRENLGQNGVNLYDICEYLKKKGATKVIFSSPWSLDN